MLKTQYLFCIQVSYGPSPAAKCLTNHHTLSCMAGVLRCAPFPPIICSMCCLYQLEFFIDAVAVSLPEADRSIMRHSTHHEKGGFLAEKRPLSYFILSEIENFQSSLYSIGFHFEERVAVIK